MNRSLYFNKEIVIFAVALSLAAGIIFLGIKYWSATNDELHKSNKLLITAKNEYERAQNNRKMLEEFNSRFELINRRNIINSENRLDWAEKIEAVTNRFNLPLVEYKIEKQEALKDASLKTRYPGIKIVRSTMHIDMQVLHEGDVFRFLSGLDEEVMGLFDVQKCTIVRTKQIGTDLLTQGDLRNFGVSCVLNWYSIKADGV